MSDTPSIRDLRNASGAIRAIYRPRTSANTTKAEVGLRGR
jgi:hypothetical protein